MPVTTTTATTASLKPSPVVTTTHYPTAQVVKDTRSPIIDLGALPDHHSVAKTLKARSFPFLDPTTIAYSEYEVGTFDLLKPIVNLANIIFEPPRPICELPPTSYGMEHTRNTRRGSDRVADDYRNEEDDIVETPELNIFAPADETVDPVAPSPSKPVTKNVKAQSEISTVEDNTPVSSSSFVRKPVAATVPSIGYHDIAGLGHRRAVKLGLGNRVLITTFPCEIISVSLVKEIVIVRGVDLFDGQTYQGSWSSNAMVPVLNVLETKYTLVSIDGNTLTLRAPDSLTRKIDCLDEVLKAGMLNALQLVNTVLVYVIHIMGKTKVYTFESV
ncbi:hypothetical protein BGX30_005184 [Mortierella sp. GBA39]|nr:hypothetical protein BGX30_005184 [Mortierella sp. GBA39]